jgi:hypothetical protein
MAQSCAHLYSPARSAWTRARAGRRPGGTPERAQFDPLYRANAVSASRPRERGQRCAAQCTPDRSAGFTYIGVLILVA